MQYYYSMSFYCPPVMTTYLTTQYCSSTRSYYYSRSFVCPPSVNTNSSIGRPATPPPSLYSYSRPSTYTFDYSVSFSVPESVTIQYRPDPRKPPRQFQIA